METPARSATVLIVTVVPLRRRLFDDPTITAPDLRLLHVLACDDSPGN